MCTNNNNLPLDNKNDKYQQSGFSLVELLVVMAIITVLSAVASTAYTNNLINSHNQAIQAKARQVRNLVNECYMTDGDVAACAVFNVETAAAANAMGVDVARGGQAAGAGVYRVIITAMTGAPPEAVAVTHTGTVANNAMTWVPR